MAIFLLNSNSHTQLVQVKADELKSALKDLRAEQYCIKLLSVHYLGTSYKEAVSSVFCFLTSGKSGVSVS